MSEIKILTGRNIVCISIFETVTAVLLEANSIQAATLYRQEKCLDGFKLPQKRFAMIGNADSMDVIEKNIPEGELPDEFLIDAIGGLFRFVL